MKFYRILLSGFLFCCAMNMPVYAAEWLMEPTVTVGSAYNDNLTLRETNEITAASSSLSARLNSQIKEQVWGMNVDARVRTTQYPNKAGRDVNNIFFKYGSNYRTELHRWNFNADFERNTTFDEDFNTQLQANGLLDAQTQREKTLLSPAWTWTMSQLWQLNASLRITDTKYDEVNTLNLSDSLSNSAQLRTSYQINTKGSMSLSAGYSVTERDQDKRKNGLYEYTNTNYQLSYRHKASELSNFNIGLGVRQTDTVGTDVPVCNISFLSVSSCFPTIFVPTAAIVLTNTDRSNSGNTFDISYNYQHEISSYSIALVKSVTTTSSGFAQEFNNYTIRYNRKVSEKISLALILNASKSVSIDSVSITQDRDTLRVEPSLSWRFSKDNRLKIGYRYRQQTFLQSDNEGKSNSIYVSLSFFWPKSISSY